MNLLGDSWQAGFLGRGSGTPFPRGLVRLRPGFAKGGCGLPPLHPSASGTFAAVAGVCDTPRIGPNEWPRQWRSGHGGGLSGRRVASPVSAGSLRLSSGISRLGGGGPLAARWTFRVLPSDGHASKLQSTRCREDCDYDRRNSYRGTTDPIQQGSTALVDEGVPIVDFEGRKELVRRPVKVGHQVLG